MTWGWRNTRPDVYSSTFSLELISTTHIPRSTVQPVTKSLGS